jgi:hypothetical protein
MSRKRRQQHQAKRAQLDHYHALDTEPAEGLNGIDEDVWDQDHDTRTWGQAKAAAGNEQRGVA